MPSVAKRFDHAPDGAIQERLITELTASHVPVANVLECRPEQLHVRQARGRSRARRGRVCRTTEETALADRYADDEYDHQQ